MNRKEMACAAAGVLLGAAGCSSPGKSLTVPAAGSEEAAATIRKPPSTQDEPHVSEVHVSLISGTSLDISSAIFRLAPKRGWSIVSNDPRLEVSIQNGYAAILQAPETISVQFQAKATISHTDATEFDVHCHVEAGCGLMDR